MSNLFSAQISPLQVSRVRDPKQMGQIFERNFLTNTYQGKPYSLGTIMAYSTNVSNGKLNGNSITEFLTTALGNTMKIVDSKEVKWKIAVANERAYPIGKDSSTGLRGQGGSSFSIYFSGPHFKKGDVLISESQYMVRLEQDMIDRGGYFEALVKIADASQDVIPTEELVEGKRFCRAYTSVEEFSDYGGGISAVTPIEFRNYLTTIRLQETVTRDFATEGIAQFDITSTDGSGKTETSWTNWIDYMMMQQLNRDIERLYHYGRVSNLPGEQARIVGPNGNPVISGAGIRGQISPANIFSHNGKISFKSFEAILEKLASIQTLVGMDFLIFTGKGGLSMVTDMVDERRNALGMNYQGVTEFYSKGADQTLTFTDPVFRSINFPNGIKATFVLNSIQDDPYMNPKRHPKTGYSIDSYRFTIIPKYASDGTSNLVSVVKKDSGKLMWCVDGSISHLSQARDSGSWKNAASNKDGYYINMLTERGIVVLNPLSAAEIIPNFNY